MGNVRMQAKNTARGTLNSDDYAVCTFDEKV